MAKKEDRRKQKKRQREAAKQKRAVAHAAARKRYSDRLRITVDPKGGDPALVKRVRSAAAEISLEESGGCPHAIARLVARVAEYGPEKTFQRLRAEAALKYDHHQEIVIEAQAQLRSVIAYVGERIFERLPEAYQHHLLPKFYFYPLYAPEGIQINFGFLERIKRDTGWGYYAKSKPTVRINNTDWVVCYSEHAIERIVERSCFEERLTYGHYMDCAAYLLGCVYFEPVLMADGNPAIRLFMMEDLGGPKQRYRDYLRTIAGINNVLDHPAIPAYVLGYCPVDCKGRFAKAISMFYPGYRGTPEDTLLRNAVLPRDERQWLLDMADDNKTLRVIHEGRHEAIRWYHENGVPQVIFPKRRLFEWAAY